MLSSNRSQIVVIFLQVDNDFAIGHQEKPHLLICGNKCGSALVSIGQADFD
jgi:hypothetical protein